MANAILTIKAECISANKSKSNSTIVFAANIQNTEKGPAARTLINIGIPDPKAANDFETGETYTITVSK